MLTVSHRLTARIRSHGDVPSTMSVPNKIHILEGTLPICSVQMIMINFGRLTTTGSILTRQPLNKWNKGLVRLITWTMTKSSTYESWIYMSTECRSTLLAVEAAPACNVEWHDYSVTFLQELEIMLEKTAVMAVISIHSPLLPCLLPK